MEIHFSKWRLNLTPVLPPPANEGAQNRLRLSQAMVRRAVKTIFLTIHLRKTKKQFSKNEYSENSEVIKKNYNE